MDVDEIIDMIKTDYNQFISYKNKSLSILIKEFIKSSIEKQRRIIILFLISEQEYQFTAHIIFDLITDKTFLSESQYLSDILFNSLHWKIQQIFKVSQENFEDNKKKLENININSVPYESRILSIKANILSLSNSSRELFIDSISIKSIFGYSFCKVWMISKSLFTAIRIF
jgi:hypothetical protein